MEDFYRTVFFYKKNTKQRGSGGRLPLMGFLSLFRVKGVTIATAAEIPERRKNENFNEIKMRIMGIQKEC